MAKAGAKKQLADNNAHLRMLRIALAVAVGIHLLGRFVVFRATVTGWHYAAALLLLGADVVTYLSLAGCAKPKYDEKGELIDGGQNLAQSGMMSYTHDVLYISLFLQVATTLLSDWFFIVLLLVPVVAAWMLWKYVIEPYVFTPQPGEEGFDRSKETAAERKKREKAERKAERGKVRYR